MNTFPLPSKNVQKEKPKENIVYNKEIGNKYADKREKPKIPLRCKPIPDGNLNLKVHTLKRTGINLLEDNNIESNDTVEPVCDSGSPKKTIGKLDKSIFEELQSKISSQKPPNTNDGTSNKAPQVKRKPVIRNDYTSSPTICPKPPSITDNKFTPPPPEQEFPPPEHEFPPPPQQIPESSNDDDIYDDIVPETNHMQMNNVDDNHQNIEEEEYEDAIYDTVENILDASEDIYDDIETPQLQQPTKPKPFLSPKPVPPSKPLLHSKPQLFPKTVISPQHRVAAPPDVHQSGDLPAYELEPEDIYDDVVEALPEPPVQTITHPPYPLSKNNNINKSALYLAPTDEIDKPNLMNSNSNITCMPQLYPQKPIKTFGELESFKFAVPVGLDTWLHKIICVNQFKLLQNGMSTIFFDKYKLQDISDTMKKNDETDTASIKSTDSKQEKENKKEKKRLKQLEKEKKAKEQQIKKRMEKDLKNFNLDVNKELTVIGNVMAGSECKGTKKDLAYQHGDEICLLETCHECPPGRILAQNMTSMRFGYISKEDFNLDESFFPEPRPRVRSLIPTEEEQGLYSDVEDSDPFPPRQQIAPRPAGAPRPPVIPPALPPLIPPPLPQTPRPIIKPDLSLPPGEIYEDIEGQSAMQEQMQEEIYDDIAY